MKIKSIFGIIAITLFTYNLNAAEPCPAGCFCTQGGTYPGPGYIQPNCSAAQIYRPNCTGDIVLYFFSGGAISCRHGWTASQGTTYYVDEFSELYRGSGGMYGFIHNDLILMPGDRNAHFTYTNSYGIYQCPVSYPHSDQGTATIFKCYKYDVNGNKIYYGQNSTIICTDGQYLPANATQCVQCDPSKNHICPGGKFTKVDTVQGLKVRCEPGQYLPANAIQCGACDTNYHFCFGGTYDFDANIDQGRITHNGYIHSNHHFVTCNPGQYIPANERTCSACPSDSVCAGGMFFTDITYGFDRGIRPCLYGNPNNTHTACLSVTTKPSFMKGKLLMNKALYKNTGATTTLANESTSSEQITVEERTPISIEKTVTDTPVKTVTPKKISTKGMMSKSALPAQKAMTAKGATKRSPR